jgi:hypothetical protein
MKSYDKLSEAPIGATVEFRYYGGSNPGSVRTVKIDKCGDGWASGVDVNLPDDNNYRRFHDASCECVTMLKPPKQIVSSTLNFVEAENELIDTIKSMNVDELVAAYASIKCNEENTSARWDEDNSCVVVDQEIQEPYFEANVDGDLVVVNSQDEKLIVAYDADNPNDLAKVTVAWSSECAYDTETNLSPKEFLEILKKHLDTD